MFNPAWVCGQYPEQSGRPPSRSPIGKHVKKNNILIWMGKPDIFLNLSRIYGKYLILFWFWIPSKSFNVRNICDLILHFFLVFSLFIWETFKYFLSFQIEEFETSITRFLPLLSSFFKDQKVKYLGQLLINHPNFFTESSYGNYLQVL